MKTLKQILIMIAAFTVYYLVIVLFLPKKDPEEIMRRNSERERVLKDMSIPPTLSDRMKDPSWTIRYWLGVDKMGHDCKIAHEYMDDGVLERTIRGRRTRGRTHNIFEYLGSCKRAPQRAIAMVTPQAKKWCHYRKTDPRLEELCSEWEKNGGNYISMLEEQYKSTELRFRTITGSAYEEKLRTM